MARRTHDLCAFVVEHYDGTPSGSGRASTRAPSCYARLRELPGYGQEKARIFVAILAKRRGVRPDGWEAAAGPFADPAPRSVADIDSPESLAKVREWKKAQKAAKKDKQDRPLAP